MFVGRHIVGMVLLFLTAGGGVDAVAQQARLKWQWHKILSMEGGAGSVAATSQSDSATIAMCGEPGAIRSTDHGRTWTARFSPQQSVFLRDYYTVQHCQGASFLASGAGANPNPGRAFFSRDHGATWTMYADTMPIHGGTSEQWTNFPGDGYARLGSAFTTDTMHTWYRARFEDGSGAVSDERVWYLGNGQFVFRYRHTRTWFQIDHARQVWVPAAIPDSAIAVFRLGEQKIVCIIPGQGTTRYQTANALGSPFHDTVIVSDNGVRLDTLYVSNAIEVDGGFIALMPVLRNDLLIVLNDQTCRVYDVRDVGMAYTRWGNPHCSRDQRFLTTVQGDLGRTRDVALFDPATGSIRVYDAPFSRLDALNFDELFVNEALDIDRKDQLVKILDLATGLIRLGGTVTDPYERFRPVMIDKTVQTDSGLVFVSEQNHVLHIKDDSTHTFIGMRVAGIPRTFPLDPLLSLKLGNADLWSDDSVVMAGGRGLVRIHFDASQEVLHADTASFWARLHDGRELTGYHHLLSRTSANSAFDTLAAPGSSASSASAPTIGAVVEANDGAWLAAMRGFVNSTNQTPTDTVHGGIWRSTDKGGTWTRMELPFGGQMVLALEKRDSDGSLWATVREVDRVVVTQEDSQGQDSVAAVEGRMGEIALLRSTDHGNTWTRVHDQRYNGRWQSTVSNAAFLGKSTIAWATQDRVWWSDDDGATWRIVDGIEGLETLVNHIVFDTNNDLYVSSSEGIYVVPYTTVGVHEPLSDSQKAFSISAYPNPASNAFTVRLHHIEYLRGGLDRCAIVDVLGRQIHDLLPFINGLNATNTVDIPIDLGSAPPGLYLLVATGSSISISHPLMLLHP